MLEGSGSGGAAGFWGQGGGGVGLIRCRFLVWICMEVDSWKGSREFGYCYLVTLECG